MLMWKGIQKGEKTQYNTYNRFFEIVCVWLSKVYYTDAVLKKGPHLEFYRIHFDIKKKLI